MQYDEANQTAKELGEDTPARLPLNISRSAAD